MTCHSTKAALARGLVKKIGHQFPPCPEGQLMHSIVAQAITDLFKSGTSDAAQLCRRKARWYLSGSMWHAQICGIDPDWIRTQLTRAGIDIAEERP
jgi:hypothetical protein